MNKRLIIGIVIALIVVVGILMFGNNETEMQSYEGIHIMANGTVMLPNGEEVEGAEVTEDGMIKLPNGAIIEPVMDLRKGGSMGEMKMENDEDMPMEMEGGG